MTKFLSVIGIAIILPLLSFTFNQPEDFTLQEEGLTIPDNVKSILDNSCYGCHNSESQNMKGKMKLKLDQLPTMKKSKQISKLSKIAKELKKGDMPPKKYIAKHPEKILSDSDMKTLTDWATTTAENLANN